MVEHNELGELIYPYDTTLVKMLYDKDLWRFISTEGVAVSDLVPTQDLISLERLREIKRGAAPEGDDLFPHVVIHNDVHYVHDGHHRYAKSLLEGARVLRVRLIQEDTPRVVE